MNCLRSSRGIRSFISITGAKNEAVDIITENEWLVGITLRSRTRKKWTFPWILKQQWGELSCYALLDKREHRLLEEFWQHITTLNTEHITPPAGSKRIVAGSCTWHCHVNVIHEKKKKKKFCQAFSFFFFFFFPLLPGYHQKVVNIQVFGHVQHSCNGFLSAIQGRPFAYSWGTSDPMMGDSQR